MNLRIDFVKIGSRLRIHLHTIKAGHAAALLLASGLLFSCESQPRSQPAGASPQAADSGSGQPPIAAGDNHVAWSEVQTSDGAYIIQYVPSPADIPANELFTMTVRVLRGEDRAMLTDGIELAVDADMPAHRHGMNTRARTSRNADGSFTVRGMMLHMSGDWEIYFDISRGGTTERAQASVTLE
jgi:hypothetical protein